MILLDNDDALVERWEVPKKHTLSLMSEIYVERGTKSDWDMLHELHYKAENLAAGPQFYRCVLRGKTIGVGVMTTPRILLSGRNDLFPKYLKPNQTGMDTKVMNTHRVAYINSEFCVNSRLVLDTIYRGAGIAYRMQNIMMRMTGKGVIEFQSSMSKFNPFAEKAGVCFVKPRRSNNYDRGLLWFRRWFETTPTDFVGVMEELESMPAAVRDKCIDEMRKTYYAMSSLEKTGNSRDNGMNRVNALTVKDLLKDLQQVAFASPLYGVYFNPDYDTKKRKPVLLPPRIPILAFDNQAVDEPMNLKKLREQCDLLKSNWN